MPVEFTVVKMGGVPGLAGVSFFSFSRSCVWTEPAAEPPTPSRALPKRAARAVLPPAVTRRVRRSRYAYQHRAFARLDIHGIPRDEIVALVETHGGRVIDVQADTWQRRWESLRYCVVRDGL